MKVTEFKRVDLVDWGDNIYDPKKYMPDVLEEGVLYIHHRFQTSAHLCACGCGNKTILPFCENMWKYETKKIKGTTEKDRPHDFTITIRPSIGNYNFPCKSHYYITDSKIEWL